MSTEPNTILLCCGPNHGSTRPCNHVASERKPLIQSSVSSCHRALEAQSEKVSDILNHVPGGKMGKHGTKREIKMHNYICACCLQVVDLASLCWLDGSKCVSDEDPSSPGYLLPELRMSLSVLH